jgi:predicted nucleotidyltransferase
MSRPALSEDVAGEKIEEMVRRIVEAARPERVILFGSRATGRPRADSDVDLLVVVADAGNTRAVAVRLYRLLAGVGIPKDIVVVNAGDFHRLKDVPGTLVRTAWREGRVLYAGPR